jgi:GxxExxY protein
MKDNTLTFEIIKCAYQVHSELGPGLLESTYEFALSYELMEMGFIVEKQKALPLNYKGQILEVGYRVDLIVNNQVILEIKAVDELCNIHAVQLLTYLKLSKKGLGLLLNFNVKSMKNGIRRVINSRKKGIDSTHD